MASMVKLLSSTSKKHPLGEVLALSNVVGSPENFKCPSPLTISTFRCLNILISCWKKTFYEVECFDVKYQVSTLQYTVYATPLSKRISKISFKNHNHKSVKYALMIKSRLKVQCAEIILKEYKSNYNYLLWIMYYT